MLNTSSAHDGRSRRSVTERWGPYSSSRGLQPMHEEKKVPFVQWVIYGVCAVGVLAAVVL